MAALKDSKGVHQPLAPTTRQSEWRWEMGAGQAVLTQTCHLPPRKLKQRQAMKLSSDTHRHPFASLAFEDTLLERLVALLVAFL